MGHYCRICGKVRANEGFSASGRRRHVCRRCKHLAAEFDADEEVLNFLQQSHISAKNIARLRQIAASGNSKRAERAATILEVALVTPYKRQRLGRLGHRHPDLLAKLVRLGLAEDIIRSTGDEHEREAWTGPTGDEDKGWLGPMEDWDPQDVPF